MIPSLRGLYPILDDRFLAPAEVPRAAVSLVRAGVTVLQLRMKGSPDRVLLETARATAAALAGTAALLVVDDRADVARIVAGDGHEGLSIGLHLGQEDLPAAEARRVVGPDVVIGLSTHDLRQVEEAATAPVDYLGFGPVFPTASKERPDPTTGIEGLRAAVRAAAKPIVAIGGLDGGRGRECLGAGAAAVAVIAALFDPPPGSAAGDVHDLGRRARALIDALG